MILVELFLPVIFQEKPNCAAAAEGVVAAHQKFYEAEAAAAGGEWSKSPRRAFSFFSFPSSKSR